MLLELVGCLSAGVVAQAAAGLPEHRGRGRDCHMIDVIQVMLVLSISNELEPLPMPFDDLSSRGEVERAGLIRAADTWGTPVFVLSEARVDEAAAQLEAAFPPPWMLHYSLKANDVPALAGRLAGRGWGANVVSVGEWAQAVAGGVPETATTFEGVGKSDAQLADVVEAAATGRPLRWLVVESEDEIVALARLAADAGLGVGRRPALDVLLRLNPEVEPETSDNLAVGAQGSKFGMTEAEIATLAAEGLPGAPGLRWRGVHVHIGSQLGGAMAWGQAGARAARVRARLAEREPSCDTVDFGGGFPTAAPGQPSPEQFRACLEAALLAEGLPRPARSAIEPGRYLVGSAGWIVASVLHTRPDRGGLPQVVIDAGMTELIRPALYGARHEIRALRVSGSDGTLAPTAVEGPICELTDTLGTHALPRLARGDLVMIATAGAYAASFTSRFNGRPQPAEVLLGADGTLRQALRAEIPRHRPGRRLAGTAESASTGGVTPGIREVCP